LEDVGLVQRRKKKRVTILQSRRGPRVSYILQQEIEFVASNTPAAACLTLTASVIQVSISRPQGGNETDFKLKNHTAKKHLGPAWEL